MNNFDQVKLKYKSNKSRTCRIWRVDGLGTEWFYKSESDAWEGKCIGIIYY